MIHARIGLSVLVAVATAIVVALGVTWAADSPTSPHLERTSSAVLFDDVVLTPGVPAVQCSSLVARGASLAELAFDGHASGSLAAAVRIRVERGSGPDPALGGGGSAPAPDSDVCDDFVPVETVYEGPLDAIPSETRPTTAAVAIPPAQPVRYRTTLTLERPDTGSTAFGLRITGLFADAPTPPQPPRNSDVRTEPPPPCVQPRSGDRSTWVVRTGGVRLVVRTPKSLPLQVVRPLPVYVTTSDRRRPTVLAGSHPTPLGRTPGGRWIGHVSAAALSRSQGVRVTSGRATVVVPITNRPCAVRVRTFLRAGKTVDLRVDARQPLSGAKVRLPAVLGTLSRGTLTVRATDERGRTRSSSGAVGASGRTATPRLPKIRIVGRKIELLDVPRGVRALSLRLRATGAAQARQRVCPRAYATTGRLTTADPSGALQTDAVHSPLRLIGDRCPRR